MKKIIVAGNVASGKTTLCQVLNGMKIEYKKTQSVEVIRSMIDTPGEYFQHRKFLRALISSAADTEVMLFVVDPTQEQSCLRSGLASTFLMDVIGVITKTDISTAEQIERAKEVLHLAGTEKVFPVSAVTGEGMKPLLEYLDGALTS